MRETVAHYTIPRTNSPPSGVYEDKQCWKWDGLSSSEGEMGHATIYVKLAKQRNDQSSWNDGDADCERFGLISCSYAKNNNSLFFGFPSQCTKERRTPHSIGPNSSLICHYCCWNCIKHIAPNKLRHASDRRLLNLTFVNQQCWTITTGFLRASRAANRLCVSSLLMGQKKQKWN